MVIVFILIGLIHMPDGPFLRPHPGGYGHAQAQGNPLLSAVVWRLALVVNILYVLLLIFTLFQVSSRSCDLADRSHDLP